MWQPNHTHKVFISLSNNKIKLFIYTITAKQIKALYIVQEKKVKLKLNDPTLQEFRTIRENIVSYWSNIDKKLDEQIKSSFF